MSFGHVEGKNEVNPSLINLVFHLDQTFTDKKLDTLVTQEILDKVCKVKFGILLKQFTRNFT